MYEFLFLFLLFMIYSFGGWIVEMIFMTIVTKKVVNRGFLIGPYCPVYGIGSLAMVFFLRKYLDDPIALFLIAIFLTSFIEYMTSLLMEKIFNARWWDYSENRFNINGRICLTNSLGFGVLGLFLLYVANPFTVHLLEMLPDKIVIILGIILLLVFVSDLVVSFNIVLKIKESTHFTKRDNTEEITKKIRGILINNFLVRRIFEAFPKFKPVNVSLANFKKALEQAQKGRTHRFKKIINKVKKKS